MPLSPGRVNATPPSSNNPHTGRGRLGGPGGGGLYYEYGTVTDYSCDTYTANVIGQRSGPMTGVPQLRTSPGEVSPLENGTQVLVSHEYGEPLILGVITRLSKQAASSPKHTATGIGGYGGQGEDKNLRQDTGNYRGPTEPDDLMPGDWSRMSRDGNGVAICTGGVNTMRSGDMCQVRTHNQNDLVEIISRNYRQVTDMGESKITNNGGKINLRFRGGSDQLTESGPDEENYSIKLDLGSEGDMFNFELTAPQGQVLFKFHVSADGKCEIYGIDGVSINSGNQNGGTSVEECTGNKIRSIQGNQTTTVVGSCNQDIGGDNNTVVSGDHVLNTANDIRNTAVRDVGLSAGRAVYVSATGGLTGDAMVFDIGSGDWVVNIGGATSLQPNSGFKMTTTGGDTAFESLTGDFTFNTGLGAFASKGISAKFDTRTIPDSVVLGGNTLAAHVVKFEQLQLALATLFNMLDMHTHIFIPGAASAGGIPVVGATGFPLAPTFTATLSSQVLAARSLTTGVAG